MKSYFCARDIIFLALLAVSFYAKGYEIALQDKWWIYDKQNAVYRPLVAVDKDFQAITTVIPKKWGHYYLLFESETGLCLYVNDKFYAYYPRSGLPVSVACSELFTHFQPADSLKITFYQPQGRLPVSSKLSDLNTTVFAARAVADNPHQILKRQHNPSYDRALIAFLIALLLFLYLKLNYRFLFKDFYTKLSNKEVNYNLPNLLLLLLIIATAWNFGLQNYFVQEQVSFRPYYVADNHITLWRWSELLHWFLIFLVWIIFKLSLIFIVNAVLGLELQRLHFYELYRSFFTLSVIGVVYLFLTHLLYWDTDYMVFFIEKLPFIGLVYITLIVLIQLNRRRYFKLLYLFLYLCTTEFIPFFIFNKLINSTT